MNKKILLVGGGGHCKSVLDSLLKIGKFSEIGIIDVRDNVGKSIFGVPIIGCDDDLPMLYEYGYNYAFVTLGSIGDPFLRKKVFTVLENIGFEIPNIVDSSAVLGHNINIKTGIFVGKNAVINSGVSIDKGTIVNTSAVIEHDCLIEKFVHIASGVVLSGEVSIGENTHIGANSVIKQQLKVGSDSIVGMGSVVLKNIESGVIAYGNPCKVVRKI